jgi:hypothetical protein
VRSRRRQKRFRPTPKPIVDLPDPFSAAYPEIVLDEERRALNWDCYECREDREQGILYDRLRRDREDDLESARDRLWRKSDWHNCPGPNCFCGDCCERREHNDPTWQEYESYKRAFPHLEM